MFHMFFQMCRFNVDGSGSFQLPTKSQNGSLQRGDGGLQEPSSKNWRRSHKLGSPPENSHQKHTFFFLLVLPLR